ncbi:DUF3120 domain-containing protein [Zarconia navalis]|uniref:DUF3120 domain-containing protein n=1 Tax=Zarconia navalis TaxID=2992134 RepID=UPI0021F86A02|nr:DUF3120 domain-containing protein [Zarconia navalis]
MFSWRGIELRKSGLIFAAAVFLVAVPVFIEAPLVRHLPGVSLALTMAWVGLSLALLSSPSTRFWGDLLLGFAGSWLAGSLYWGWLRWEPLWHLPVEAIVLPFSLWCLYRRRLTVGSWFAIVSFFGTAVTDGYFYLVGLMPRWRELMQVEPELVAPIFGEAIAQVRTPWGALCALVLAAILLLGGLLPLRGPNPPLHYWAFSGAVLSTILVDALFWLAALAAVG